MGYVWAVFGDSEIASFVPACIFLDYMLLGEKTKLGGDQVTILPEVYAKQQAQLATVLGRLVVPKLASYKNIFYGLEQEGTVVYEELNI